MATIEGVEIEIDSEAALMEGVRRWREQPR
jgi:hypothetical protein